MSTKTTEIFRYICLACIFVIGIFAYVGCSGSSSNDEIPHGADHTASGTYNYNSDTGTFTWNTIDSDFEGCGPDMGVQEVTISSVTDTTMIWITGPDEQIIWTRDGGTNGDIVGVWRLNDDGNTYELDLNLDGTYYLRANIIECGDDDDGNNGNEDLSDQSFSVPVKTITIDGAFDDWSVNDRIYQDTNGADCSNATGQDIQEVYIAQDDNFIYLRYVLNGPLDESFGYKFGDDLHLYVGYSNGNIRMFFCLPPDNYPQLLDSYLYENVNQFECKFEKTTVASWADKNLSAWCDQGGETVCRDYIALPQMDLDFN